MGRIGARAGWFAAALLAALLVVGGCGRSKGERAAPVARPGENRVVAVGTEVSLDGAASTVAAGRPIAYQWSFASVPPGSEAELSDPTAARPTFTADVAGVYVVQLVVDDGEKESEPATVVLTAVVDDQPPTAVLVVLDADGSPLADNRVAFQTTFALDAGASVDAGGGNIAAYRWEWIDGPDASFPPSASVETSEPRLVLTDGTLDTLGLPGGWFLLGTHVFQVVVVDEAGNASEPARATVEVVDVVPPIASLVVRDGEGSIATQVPYGTTFSLASIGSVDLGGGGIVRYRWEWVDGPPGSSVPTNTPRLFLTDGTLDRFGLPGRRLPVGTHVFQLVVVDVSGNASEPARATVEVVDVVPPTASLAVLDADGSPLADDRVAFQTTFALDAGASVDAGGGNIAAYRWGWIDGPDASFPPSASVETSEPRLVLTDGTLDTLGLPGGLLPLGTYVFQVVVVDEAGNASEPARATVEVVDEVPPTASLVVRDGEGSIATQVPYGTTVVLDGRGSVDLGGGKIVRYQWEWEDRPGSSVPTYTPKLFLTDGTLDRLGLPGGMLPIGAHVFQLVVVDDSGNASEPARATVEVVDEVPPAASLVVRDGEGAIALQVPYGTTVVLDGRGSVDLGGGKIVRFQWEWEDGPAGSSVPTYTPKLFLTDGTLDRLGQPGELLPIGAHVFQLVVVDDSGNASEPARATVEVVENRAPTASAGPDQAVAVGAVVTLDGTGSTDPDGDPLTYAWTLVSRPDGSQAVLTGGTTVQPNFTADLYGAYQIELVVSDGMVESAPSVVTVTADRVWGTAASIHGTSIGSPPEPQVASAPGGDFYVLWHQLDNGLYALYAIRYDAVAGTWDPPEPLVSGSSTIPADLNLVVDEAGVATAVWSGFSDSGIRNVYVSRYGGTGWSAPEVIDRPTESSYALHAAVDGGGNVFVVWYFQDAANSTLSVAAARFDASTGAWGDPVELEAGAGSVHWPRVAADAAGNAVAVWRQIDAGGDYAIAANRYDAATGTWGGARWIDSTAVPAGLVDVAVDAAGDAVAVWLEHDGAYTVTDVVAARYDVVSDSWTAPVQIETGSDYIFSSTPPRAAMDADGNAYAVWEHGANDPTLGQQVGSVHTSRYDVVTGAWSAPAELDATPYDARTPSVAVDPAGNVIVVWRQTVQAPQGDQNPVYSVHAARYDGVAGAWTAPEEIGSQPADAVAPRVAVDPDGNALAVWGQELEAASTYEVWGNFYR